VLSARPLTGLDGLAAVLAETLGDPGLRVYRWLDASARDVDAHRITSTPGPQHLRVDDADGPVALIEHDAPALQDPPTARAVQAAVRLAVVNLRLRELQLTQLRELEAARARVVAAADDQRASVATDLRQKVTVLLRDAQAELSAARRQGLAPDAAGLGYLLKERVSDIAVLVDALRRVVDRECVLDPTIVARLMQRRRPDSPLTQLTPREREILALMAEGRSNSAIATELTISERTVEAASAAMFRKLGLEPSADVNRRVLAVLTALRG